MWKIIVKYGSILFVVLSAFKLLEYSFFSYKISLDVYLGVVAFSFLVIGGVFAWLFMRKQIGNHKRPLGEGKNDLARFSQRELEVLQYLSSGYSNKEIARCLQLSPNTVKTHLKSIYEKLGVSNRTQAASEARLLKIIN